MTFSSINQYIHQSINESQCVHRFIVYCSFSSEETDSSCCIPSTSEQKSARRMNQRIQARKVNKNPLFWSCRLWRVTVAHLYDDEDIGEGENRGIEGEKITVLSLWPPSFAKSGCPWFPYNTVIASKRIHSMHTSSILCTKLASDLRQKKKPLSPGYACRLIDRPITYPNIAGFPNRRPPPIHKERFHFPRILIWAEGKNYLILIYGKGDEGPRGQRSWSNHAGETSKK